MTEQNTPDTPDTPDTTDTTDTTDTPAELSLDGMTDAQIDAIHARIEERRNNRPPSLAAQLDQLSKQIAGTADAQGQAAEKRRTGRDEADELGRTLAELRSTMRKMELKEAAQAARFKHPDKVIDFLAPQLDAGTDLPALVAAAAASGVFVMEQPAPSAQIGGPGGKPAPKMDAGRAGLIAEIREAQGR